MPGIEYSLGLDNEAFVQGAAQSMDYINQLHGRIDKLSTAGGGGNGFLKGLSTTLFQLPQQVAALQGMMGTLSIPIKLAASAETTSVAFKVLIGDAARAEAVLGKIRKLADTTPFEFPELAGAARLLVAFGESADGVDETLRRVGDIASGISAPIGEIAELYGKARVQGTLFAEDINQLTGRGIPIIQEFAKQLGVSESAVKKLASDGKVSFSMLEQAFTDMTNGGGKFAGMMAATAETMEGKLSTLSDSFKRAMTNVGEGLNEALKPLVTDTATQLDGLKDKAKEIGTTLGEAVDVAVVAFNTGKLGEGIITAFRAGGLMLADQIVKAISWGADYLKLKWIQIAPNATAGEKARAAKGEERLKEQGLDEPHLGIKKLTDAAKQARTEFDQTADTLIKAGKARRNQREEQKKADDIAAAEKKAAAAEDTINKGIRADIDARALRNGPTTVPTSGAGSEGNYNKDTLFQLQERKAEMDKLDGIGAASASQPKIEAPGKSTGSGSKGSGSDDGGDQGTGDFPTPSGPSSASLGRSTIKGAGYGKKDGPREGLSYFKKGKMGGVSTPALDNYSAFRKAKGVGFKSPLDALPDPSTMGIATGRQQARQAKQAESAEREQGKAKASNSSGNMETMVRKIAEQVAMIAKAKESEQTI